MGTQCDMELDIDRDRNRKPVEDIDEKIENPLSDTSTWNTELPNIGIKPVIDALPHLYLQITIF